MDIDKVKENLKNTVFQEYAKSVGKLIRRDYNTIIKIIDDGDLYDILEDNYYIYNDLDDAKQEFDIVTARAVAPLKHLLEYGIPLVKIKGNFIAMKGKTEKEEENIENYLDKLDIIEEKRIIFNLPYEDSLRTIIKYKKNKKTNNKYPRKYNEIIKKDI